MADASSDPDSPDPRSFSSAFDAGTDFDPQADAPPWNARADDSREDFSPSFALNVARIWVQRHQKASMLGAFAVGVFVGAMLRD